MKIHISDSYEEMSQQAASHVLEALAPVKNPLLCPASGDSPKGAYDHLTAMIRQEGMDVSSWKFVGLDEWVGMNGSDEGSCRFYLDRQLFLPLNADQHHICFFDGKASDLQEECDRTEQFIHSNDGIDVAVVGLGLNGHVGMNEPGTSPLLRSHVADIDTITQESGQKYFKEKTIIDKGITLGLANLMEAREVILLVSGNKKAAIVKQILEGEISEQWPASLLRRHKHFSVYLDSAAAFLLKSQ
jgi:glucosamine-6-phosphate isomerase